MKKSSRSEQQILAILKEAEAGVPMVDLCRQHGMSQGAFYKRQAKYAGWMPAPCGG